MTELALTGSTGWIGGRVAALLAARGVPMRLLVRDASRAPDLPGTEAAVIGSYADRVAVRTGLQGVRTVLWVSAAESADRRAQHQAFIEAAAEAGVEHVVYTSFLGAGPEATFTLARDHHATEQAIRGTGLHHTFLRDNLYADVMSAMAGADRVLRGPAGQGRVSLVARRDVAEAAAAVLLDPTAHRGLTHDLTGPEALTFDEIAAVLSRVTGTRYAYHDETIEEAYASRLAWPAQQWQYDAWVSTYTAVAAGELATVSDAVPRLTGHRATSFADLLADAGPDAPTRG